MVRFAGAITCLAFVALAAPVFAQNGMQNGVQATDIPPIQTPPPDAPSSYTPSSGPSSYGTAPSYTNNAPAGNAPAYNAAPPQTYGSAPVPGGKDATAIDKDNAQIEKNNVALERDRVMKAQNKASGNFFGQAVDSISIGYDRFMVGEKKAEKSVDEEIMNQDTK